MVANFNNNNFIFFYCGLGNFKMQFSQSILHELDLFLTFSRAKSEALEKMGEEWPGVVSCSNIIFSVVLPGMNSEGKRTEFNPLSEHDGLVERYKSKNLDGVLEVSYFNLHLGFLDTFLLSSPSPKSKI